MTPTPPAGGADRPASPPRMRRPRTDTGPGPADRILAAAGALLFAKGMDGLTTDRLARDAKVSKSSIYKHYPDMAVLLEAVIAREAALISYGLPREPPHAGAYWTALKAYGANLLQLLNRPEVIRLDQLMHEQAHRHPDVARRFFEATYGRSMRELEAMLAYGVAHRFIRRKTDPRRDAELLLSMWEGLAFGRARLGLTDRPFPDPTAWADACVDRLYPNDVW